MTWFHAYESAKTAGGTGDRGALAPPKTALDGAGLAGGGIVAGIAIEGH